ncbi:MAG: c-type cytochrome [Acidobacteriota bacterium]
MRGRKLLLLVVPALAGIFFIALVFILLERYTAYRSPLYGAEPAETPRMRALADLEEWARQKSEEKARLAELMKSLNTEKMVDLGKDIVHGRGLCFNCHKIGSQGRGTQGPNLLDVGARAGSRIAGKSDIQYLAESLYRPDAFIVPGFTPAMTPANRPPIALNDLDILMVIAYLQSLGGTPTVTPDTKLPY